jgi:hypothetical protein
MTRRPSHPSVSHNQLLGVGICALVLLTTACQMAPPPGTSHSPSGHLDSLVSFIDENPPWVPTPPAPTGGRVDGAFDIQGWASDWDTTEPIRVRVWVSGHNNSDGTPIGPFWFGPYTANTARPDIDAAYHRGANFGFSVGTPLPSNAANPAHPLITVGEYHVCVVALNVGPGDNTVLGCETSLIDPTYVGGRHTPGF